MPSTRSWPYHLTVKVGTGTISVYTENSSIGRYVEKLTESSRGTVTNGSTFSLYLHVCDNPPLPCRDTTPVVADEYREILASKRFVACHVVGKIKGVDHFFYRYLKDVLLYSLSRTSIWPLHGGMIGSEDNNVLLVGPRGSGKTTLCLLSSLCSLDFLSDDILLLDPRISTVFSLPRDMHIRPDMIDAIPTLDRSLSNSYEPYLPGHEALSVPPRVWFSDRVRTSMRWPAAALSLSVDGTGPTTLSPMPKEDAFHFLMQQWEGDSSLRPKGEEAMADALSSLPFFRFSMGADLLRNPQILLRFFSAFLDVKPDILEHEEQ